MSLLTGKPPYDAVEVENVAHALARGEAVWQWYNSREAQQVFRTPLFALKPVTRAQVFVDGGIMLFEFLPPGQKSLPDQLVPVQTMKWADAVHAKMILLRAREVEWFMGKGNVPEVKHIENSVRNQEALRLQIVADPKFMQHARDTEAKG